uniref:Uncharacterized protein n=1 Tax=Mycena chlorophos TaxID=658473 RepID=A0ABQ0LQZ1_MYCCL|nr:predicted protein [Mycena chlorophos]
MAQRRIRRGNGGMAGRRADIVEGTKVDTPTHDGASTVYALKRSATLDAPLPRRKRRASSRLAAVASHRSPLMAIARPRGEKLLSWPACSTNRIPAHCGEPHEPVSSSKCIPSLRGTNVSYAAEKFELFTDESEVTLVAGSAGAKPLRAGKERSGSSISRTHP